MAFQSSNTTVSFRSTVMKICWPTWSSRLNGLAEIYDCKFLSLLLVQYDCKFLSLLLVQYGCKFLSLLLVQYDCKFLSLLLVQYDCKFQFLAHCSNFQKVLELRTIRRGTRYYRLKKVEINKLIDRKTKVSFHGAPIVQYDCKFPWRSNSPIRL